MEMLRRSRIESFPEDVGFLVDCKHQPQTFYGRYQGVTWVRPLWQAIHHFIAVFRFVVVFPAMRICDQLPAGPLPRFMPRRLGKGQAIFGLARMLQAF
jgi:hypothetical protein